MLFKEICAIRIMTLINVARNSLQGLEGLYDGANALSGAGVLDDLIAMHGY